MQYTHTPLIKHRNNFIGAMIQYVGSNPMWSHIKRGQPCRSIMCLQSRKNCCVVRMKCLRACHNTTLHFRSWNEHSSQWGSEYSSSDAVGSVGPSSSRTVCTAKACVVDIIVQSMGCYFRHSSTTFVAQTDPGSVHCKLAVGFPHSSATPVQAIAHISFLLG